MSDKVKVAEVGKNKAEVYINHVVVEFDGLHVMVMRSAVDGALMVEIDSSEVGRDDAFPGDLVPRLVLAINDHSQQLDQHGNWQERTEYEPLTVLDHLAAT